MTRDSDCDYNGSSLLALPCPVPGEGAWLLFGRGGPSETPSLGLSFPICKVGVGVPPCEDDGVTSRKIPAWCWAQ